MPQLLSVQALYVRGVHRAGTSSKAACQQPVGFLQAMLQAEGLGQDAAVPPSQVGPCFLMDAPLHTALYGPLLLLQSQLQASTVHCMCTHLLHRHWRMTALQSCGSLLLAPAIMPHAQDKAFCSCILREFDLSLAAGTSCPPPQPHLIPQPPGAGPRTTPQTPPQFPNTPPQLPPEAPNLPPKLPPGVPTFPPDVLPPSCPSPPATPSHTEPSPAAHPEPGQPGASPLTWPDPCRGSAAGLPVLHAPELPAQPGARAQNPPDQPLGGPDTPPYRLAARQGRQRSQIDQQAPTVSHMAAGFSKGSVLQALL